MEAEEVMSYFREALGEDADERTIWGMTEDPASGEEFRVTLIATGFQTTHDSATPAMAAINARASQPHSQQPLFGQNIGRQVPTQTRDGSGVRLNAPTALGAAAAPTAMPSPVREPSSISRPALQNPITIPASRPQIRSGRNTGGFLALPPDQLDDFDESAIPSFMRR